MQPKKYRLSKVKQIDIWFMKTHAFLYGLSTYFICNFCFTRKIVGQTVWQQLSKALIYDIFKFLVIDSDFGMRNCSLLFLMAHRKVIGPSTKKVPQQLKEQHRKISGG